MENMKSREAKENRINRERPYEKAERDVEYLKLMETGQLDRVELSNEQKSEVVDFANKFSRELKEIYNDQEKAKTFQVYPDFLTTEKGKALASLAINAKDRVSKVEEALREAGLSEESLSDKKLKTNIASEIASHILSKKNEDTPNLAEQLKEKFSLSKTPNIDKSITSTEEKLEKIESTADAQNFIFANSENIAQSSKEFQGIISKVTSESYKHAMDKSIAPLVEANQSDNPEDVLKAIDNAEIEPPQRQQVMLKPEALLTRMKNINEFKKKLRDTYTELKKDESPEGQSKRILLNLYARHINDTSTWNLYPAAFSVVQKAESLGYDNLSDAEKGVVAEVIPKTPKWKEAQEQGRETDYVNRYAKKLDKVANDYDRFHLGTTSEVVDDPNSPHAGKRMQVGEELLAKARAVQKYYETEVPQKRANDQETIDSLGWNKEKMANEYISGEKFNKWINRIMESVGIGGEPSDDPTKGWKGVAKDLDGTGIWVASNSKELVTSKKYSGRLDGALINVRHEMTHVNQSINRANIANESGLEFFSTHQGGRSSIYAEGGAITHGKELAKNMFGQESSGNPRYVFILSKRLEGGNFSDCYKAMLKPDIEIILANAKAGLHTSPEETKKLIGKTITADFSRTTRPFYGIMGMEKATPYLGSSLSSSYLEQELLGEKLEEAGMSDYLQMGLSADTILDLYQAGLIDNPREKMTIWTQDEILGPIQDEINEYLRP